MTGALDGIRILEISGPRTQFASMLLAGMGADVWLVEPPEGSALRRVPPLVRGRDGSEHSLPFFAHHSNKKSIALDFARDDGRAVFRRLARRADVILESELPGELDEIDIGFDACRRQNPGLIWVSVTPYGSTGPSSRLLGSDLSAQAMGGAIITTGEPRGRVFKACGDAADKMAAYTAASALMVAILEREKTGHGQLVDVSAQEAVAGQMERGAIFYQFTHTEPERGGRLYPTAAFPCGLFPASDGWISLVALQPQHWDALVNWVGDARLAVERFKIGAERALARETIDRIISEWSRKHSKHELSAEGQRRRIAVAALQSPSEVTRDPHLLATDFFVEVADPEIGTVRIPGAPIRASATPFRVASAAPRLGEQNHCMDDFLPRRARDIASKAPTLRSRHTGISKERAVGSAPLAGYRVLDLSWVIAGPACTRFLADQGAEVIKIESTRTGDPVRTFGPWLDGENTAPEGGGAFALLNRNKRSITLDLKRPEGVKLLLLLAKQSDVVVDNFAAGTMDRLGLSYTKFAGVNPAIVMAQLSGFGQTGPYAHRVAYGQTLLALTAHYDQIGEPDSTPMMPGYTYTDQAAGMIGAFAIMAALYHRDRSGEGQHLDLSLFHMGSSLMADALIEPLVNGTDPVRCGNFRADAISHGVYRSKGVDKWCVIATWSAEQWDCLLAQIAHDDAALAGELAVSQSAQRMRNEIDALIERWTIRFSNNDIMERLQKSGIEAAMVQGPRDLLESDVHLRERGFFQSFTHEPSARVLQMEGIPYRLSDSKRALRNGPPRLGEANDYVFRELLNLGSQEINTLVASGVIG